MKSVPKKALVEVVPVALTAVVLSIALFVFIYRESIEAVSSWQDLETKESVAVVRSAMQFMDSQVGGIKHINMSNSYTTRISDTEVTVLCTGPDCDAEYVAFVPHGVPAGELMVQNPSKTGSICVVKKKFGSETKIAVCSSEEERLGNRCCSLEE